MNAARSPRTLSTVAPIIFGLIVVLALLSIIGRWPHQFGGHGDPDHIIQELLTSGTATAPPLPMLIVFGVVAWTVRRTDRWGVAARILLIPLAVLMAVGAIGEAAAPASPDVPRLVQLGNGVFGVVTAALLAVLAVASLTHRSAPGRVAGVHAEGR
jgi:hypothetical protein